MLESFPENDQSWRLLTIDERTPEEMFTKYLDTKCWDEALELANVYGLDTNAIYKKKWFALVDDLCKHNVSSNSKSVGISASAIIETLSSISDRKWVVAECLLPLSRLTTRRKSCCFLKSSLKPIDLVILAILVPMMKKRSGCCERA